METGCKVGRRYLDTKGHLIQIRNQCFWYNRSAKMANLQPHWVAGTYNLSCCVLETRSRKEERSLRQLDHRCYVLDQLVQVVTNVGGLETKAGGNVG